MLKDSQEKCPTSYGRIWACNLQHQRQTTKQSPIGCDQVHVFHSLNKYYHGCTILFQFVSIASRNKNLVAKIWNIHVALCLLSIFMFKKSSYNYSFEHKYNLCVCNHYTKPFIFTDWQVLRLSAEKSARRHLVPLPGRKNF